MLEFIEMTAEAVEAGELTQLQEMYQKAYETALQEGAQDMAGFYKEKMEALENGMETAGLTDLQEMYQDAYDSAVREGATDMAEFYRKKLGIGDNELSFGGDTSERGWLSKADREFAKNGESRYYKYCMEQAAIKHREGER